MRNRDAAKEKKILEAAINLIAEKGLTGVSMSQIAKASGVPQATIYVYFSSKEELFRELYRYVIRKQCDFLLTDFDVSGDVKECFKEYFWRSVDYNRCYPNDFQVYGLFMSSSYIKDFQMENVTELFKPLYSFVIRGQEMGIIKKDLHPIVVLSYFSLIATNIERGKLYWGNQADDPVYQLVFDTSWDAVINHNN